MLTTKKLTRSLLALSLVGELGVVGCSHAGTGAAIGAGAGGAVGAGIGAAAGKNGKSAAIGALIGAAVGGATGAAIGHVMDKRAEQIQRDLEGAEVQRVGEGILVTFDSGILFPLDEASLTPAAKANIQNLGDVLARYEDMDILIAGHTDATGSDSYNEELSQKRAQSVAQYVSAQGVQNSRIQTVGEGETKPVASNETEMGRRKNRRVEVAIYASGELKEHAEDMAGGA